MFTKQKYLKVQNMILLASNKRNWHKKGEDLAGM